MDKEYYRQKLKEIKTKLACLPVTEKGNINHPYYQEQEAIKKEYAKFLYDEKMKEKEESENDQHKRR